VRRRVLVGLGLAAVVGGCFYLVTPIAKVPMDTLRLDAPCAEGRPATLIVMLPGAYSRPGDFVEEGFVDALRQRGIAADVVVADSHIGYVIERSLFERLHEDVVRPAKARGYQRVWLLGISLGGFAALGYAVLHPGEVDGVVALAPYLGARKLLDEISAAGGPTRWLAQTSPAAEDDADRRLWRALAGGTLAVPVYLGYGRDDRFADAHRLLSGVLPAERVTTAAGGHDWPAWRELWEGWLDRGSIPAGCRAAA
jgi:pimeloyl-ACP methyl ester carboxylesterase